MSNFYQVSLKLSRRKLISLHPYVWLRCWDTLMDPYMAFLLYFPQGRVCRAADCRLSQCRQVEMHSRTAVSPKQIGHFLLELACIAICVPPLHGWDEIRACTKLVGTKVIPGCLWCCRPTYSLYLPTWIHSQQSLWECWEGMKKGILQVREIICVIT